LSVEQVLWLSALGGLLALDHALVGQFMLAQPIVVGSIFGALLGDLPTGLFVGALVQLIWLGVISVGAYIPPDYTITGGVAVGLAETFTHELGLAPGPSIIVALVAAIPAGLLAGQLDTGVRHFVNGALARRAEAALEAGRVPHLGAMHVLALVPSWLKGFVVYWLWLGPAAFLLSKIVSQLPRPALAGLDLAFWALPALAFAAVFELSTRDRIQGWGLGAFLGTWLMLGLWPQAGGWVLVPAVACGVAAAWRGGAR
jgi:mannose/fructose/N-acetylgalactosamine-specific phosphotransferase system component IIC